MIDANPDFTVQHPELDDSYDVIVVGGGPAGATTGALVAEYGHKTLVLDRAEFPRHHVGESLIPETYWSLDDWGLSRSSRHRRSPRSTACSL